MLDRPLCPNMTAHKFGVDRFDSRVDLLNFWREGDLEQGIASGDLLKPFYRALKVFNFLDQMCGETLV